MHFKFCGGPQSGTLACRDDIFKEIDILCDLTHENVIFMKEYFEENNKVMQTSLIAKHAPCCEYPHCCWLAGIKAPGGLALWHVCHHVLHTRTMPG